jgi:hypothetical protein
MRNDFRRLDPCSPACAEDRLREMTNFASGSDFELQKDSCGMNFQAESAFVAQERIEAGFAQINVTAITDLGFWGA